MNNGSLDFDSWYAGEHPRVLVAVALVCAEDHARAEDATNGAFVKAYERWGSVSAMDSPRAWVTRVAINNAKRGWRRRARGIELMNSERLATTSIDSHVDVDLWDSVKKLSFNQRKAIVLRYIEGLPQAEVAAEMGVAVGTASATLNQARQVLRNDLEGDRS